MPCPLRTRRSCSVMVSAENNQALPELVSDPLSRATLRAADCAAHPVALGSRGLVTQGSVVLPVITLPPYGQLVEYGQSVEHNKTALSRCRSRAGVVSNVPDFGIVKL